MAIILWFPVVERGIMLKVTLDTNCLIDVENWQGGYQDILKLKKLNDTGQIQLALPAMIASEKRVKGVAIKDFNVFMDFLKTFHFDDLELLAQPFYWDISFWGQAMWLGEEEINLDKRLHSILFPNINFDCNSFIEANRDSNDIEKLRQWVFRCVSAG